MTILHIDFETRSTVDLKRTGVYRYAEDPSTDVWCAGYAVDDAFIDMWTPGYVCPPAIVDAVARGDIFVAHNAQFERVLWKHILTPRYGWPEPKLEQWRCTMAAAYAMALPGSLQNAAAAVGLDTGKDMGGHDLMLRMAKPRRARKGENPGQHWFDDEERKQRLYAYCRQDVEVERQLHKRLLELRPQEQHLWQLDQTINDRGVYVDLPLCEAALDVVNQATTWLDDELRTITDGAVQAITNVGQITAWLRASGMETASLNKEAIDEMLVRADLSAPVRRVLEIRREGAKAAVAKISALIAGRSADGRARGLMQYHAASSGRWAGRRFQPQNIRRPIGSEAHAVEAVATGSARCVQMLYGEPLNVVGDALRGMVRAAPGNVLYAADYSAIEGRIIAWLAGEEWKLDLFRSGADVYCATASKILGRPIGKKDPERQGYGKVPELALGYQGGVVAFQKMAHNYNVTFTDEQAEQIKLEWRSAHPKVVRWWYDMQDAATDAIDHPGAVYRVSSPYAEIAFRVAGSFLFMRLPSGRSICYPYPCIKQKETPWGEMCPQICYQGLDTYTHKWGDCFAYGGLLFNNAVQGIARDILAEAIVRLERHGYPVVLHVHDEVVCETFERLAGIAEFEMLMCELPTWAAGLPITAEAWSGERYHK